MKQYEPQKDERPIMIITGILTLYVILVAFCVYLFCLSRISFETNIILIFVITIFHLPRFLIIKKLLQIERIKINQNNLEVGNKDIPFEVIEKFSVKEYKPNIIFFLNNRMIIFKYAKFILKTAGGEIEFCVQGSEKITLLKEFLTALTTKN